ncbi:MAG: HEAT repeat domain-containing protein, partial [Tannerellaceae bacterium]|nr:HEAT repeat domain-containing protein [Tannerellaceae bacterium]
MKKIDRLFSLLLVLFVCVGGLMAQSPGNRTARTIVADVLAQMPADNPAVYEKQIKDLATAGEEGVLLLADMINPPGKGSNAQVEYALSGLSAYVSEKGREELRTVVAKAYAKALDKVSEKEIKAFIIGQLQLVGGDESVDALSRYLGDERLGDPAARALASIKPAAAVEPPHDIKAATALLKKTAKSGEVHQRIAALQAVLSIQGKEGMKWVQSALKDPSREYRNAALDFTSRFADGEVYVDLLKTMIKAKQPEVKVDILNWLGRESLSAEKNPIIRNLEIRFDLPARLALLNQLKDGSFDVRQAAVFALVRIGDPSVIASLADLLTSDDGQTVQLAKEALAVFNGDIRSVARVIPSASDAGKIAGVELLAMRRASSTINRVLDLIKTGSPEVKAAAYTALKDVVTDKDFTLLCGMLETAEAEAVPPLQQAVIASVSAMPGEGRAGVVFRRMLQAGENRKYLYYTVLSATGDQEALGTIMNGFRADKGVAKDAAFDALLSWKGVEVAGELLA